MKKTFIKDRIAMLVLLHQTSEKEVSRQLGCSPGYIQSITSGRALPSFEMFFKICDYFGLTPAEFFDESSRNPQQLHRLWEYSRKLNEQQTNLLLQIMDTLTTGTNQTK